MLALGSGRVVGPGPRSESLFSEAESAKSWGSKNAVMGGWRGRLSLCAVLERCSSAASGIVADGQEGDETISSVFEGRVARVPCAGWCVREMEP